MAGAPVGTVKLDDIKSKLLRPALTSHYICNFQPPTTGFLNDRLKNLYAENTAIKRYDLLSLACAEASLPGSTLATHEINNDYTGVTERHAYRRQYDDRADFTFYVDSESYYVIKFFESWIGYAVNEQYGENGKKIVSSSYNYRVNYPDNYYAKSLTVTKFERDYDLSSIKNVGTKSSLEYNFIKAFPININSMPVSYDSSQLLKCTVSFTYSRYWIQQLINDTPAPNIDNTFTPNTVNASTGTLTDAGPNDFLNIGNPALDQFGVRDQLGRGAEGTIGANILG